MTWILAAGELGRHWRGVLAGACSECGSALRYTAGPRVWHELSLSWARCQDARPVNNACRQQQLRARHGQPAESTTGKEALWRLERHWW